MNVIAYLVGFVCGIFQPQRSSLPAAQNQASSVQTQVVLGLQRNWTEKYTRRFCGASERPQVPKLGPKSICLKNNVDYAARLHFCVLPTIVLFHRDCS